MIPQPELVPIGDLKPHPRNYRAHPQEQLDHIVASIREHGFYRNVVAAEDLTILAGHGVVEAAAQVPLEAVPVVILAISPDSAQALKVLAADNLTPTLALDDDAALLAILQEIHESDALLGTGVDEDHLAALLNDPAPDLLNYSRKIQAPVYEPRGDRPQVEELIDREKTIELLDQIRAADLPAEVASFLEYAAERHTRFSFSRIAEFYAHADAETQALMEASALVIIDFEKAIEGGFVRISESLQGLAAEDAK